MLYLLDDSDEQVVDAVCGRLLTEGLSVIPMLEQYWVSNSDPLRAGRIEQVIRNIQTDVLSGDFRRWMDSEDRDLLQACLLVSRIHYPGLDIQSVVGFVENLCQSALRDLVWADSPHEKIQVLNRLIFGQYGFKGNNDNYHNPDNSFINRVIETRTGNPISLCNLYAIVARRVGIPVFGVNLPQHFVLAYCEDDGEEQHQSIAVKREDFGRVLFYINPFSAGQIFLSRNIRDFLEVIKIEPQPEFFEPCNNLEILRRMLRNLHYAYAENQDHDRRKLVEHYMNLAGMMREIDEDTDEE